VIRRYAMIAALTATLLATGATAAAAHDIADTGPRGVAGFVWLGFTHMLLGWDHLLFLTGVVALAWQPSRAVRLVSLFALGHSATLIAGTLAGWRLNARLVDVVIVNSLVFVGLVGVIGRPRRYHWFGAAVLGFGLVHGLGLATRLQQLDVPRDGLFPRVLAFNLGVELGQLLAVYLIYLIGDAVVGFTDWPRIERPAFAALLLTGVAAGLVMSLLHPAGVPVAAARPPFNAAVRAAGRCAGWPARSPRMCARARCSAAATSAPAGRPTRARPAPALPRSQETLAEPNRGRSRRRR
jgi:hydrogenase/urease accessory protein HupE